MSEVDRFFRDFPLSFVGRLPKSQSIPAQVLPMAEAKRKITSHLDEESEAASALRQLYLAALGVFSCPHDFPYDPEGLIKRLVDRDVITQSTLGFLHELDPDTRKYLTEIKEKSPEVETYSQLRRHIYAHGLRLPSDASPLDLLRIIKWIHNNEPDHVDFYKMTSYMQNAIDLSVMLQNIDSLTDALSDRKDLQRSLQDKIAESEETLSSLKEILTESVKFNQSLLPNARLHTGARFQQKVFDNLNKPTRTTSIDNTSLLSADSDQTGNNSVDE